ncbi:unnamed protein product [Triticum turgidum subsp. durum]|uniref:Uncharacterized protein n=1 Tax=Triticum turgidum subsp. durum TaxID=4567 RepID=A0A9R0Q926_TRITD|nr:unnamed protein product [Triticum turgidum subsp. durum]
MLDEGKELGMPDGVLINGKGPYRYNDSLVPAGIEHETIDVHPGNSLPHIIALLLLAFWVGNLHHFYSELNDKNPWQKKKKNLRSGGAGCASCIAFIQTSVFSLDKNLVSEN